MQVPDRSNPQIQTNSIAVKLTMQELKDIYLTSKSQHGFIIFYGQLPVLWIGSSKEMGFSQLGGSLLGIPPGYKAVVSIEFSSLSTVELTTK